MHAVVVSQREKSTTMLSSSSQPLCCTDSKCLRNKRRWIKKTWLRCLITYWIPFWENDLHKRQRNRSTSSLLPPLPSSPSPSTTTEGWWTTTTRNPDFVVDSRTHSHKSMKAHIDVPCHFKSVKHRQRRRPNTHLVTPYQILDRIRLFVELWILLIADTWPL